MSQLSIIKFGFAAEIAGENMAPSPDKPTGSQVTAPAQAIEPSNEKIGTAKRACKHFVDRRISIRRVGVRFTSNYSRTCDESDSGQARGAGPSTTQAPGLLC